MQETEHWQKWQPQQFSALPGQEPDDAVPTDFKPTEVPVVQPVAEAALLSDSINHQALNQQERQQSWQEGYQQGLNQGEQHGRTLGFQEGQQAAIRQSEQQQQAQQQHITQLADSFDRSLQVLDGVITGRILQLALQIALQISGEAIKCDSHQLTEQIRSLLSADPLFTGTPRLRVHPQDLPLAEQLFSGQISSRGWKAEADPHLQPGDCLLQGEEGELDCSMSTRWLELCQRAQTGVY
ncbi:hypothetical protein A7K99_11085 [Tatumella citrea]|uniref:Flagellar assembly protein FliH n=1 Tax=Tatumella citrea TaxID=53336 RepID=A0A1Y0L9F8_TATCI|nr:hypothetical protein A7K98_11085 [Tatumella citrea]ARU98308.1 hypothetical protein A7K99_11085 [Tatumella citrea]